MGAAEGQNSTVLTNIAISDERSLSVTGISPTAITCPSPSLECLVLALRRAVHRAHHCNNACVVPQTGTVKPRPSSSTPAIAPYNSQHQARAPTCGILKEASYTRQFLTLYNTIVARLLGHSRRCRAHAK